MSGRSGVAVDVTTVVSAGEFIVASNHERPPLDPFAGQSFLELIQSLILQPSVGVLHPLKLAPQSSDYGSHPHFLQCLFEAGLVHPFTSTQGQDELDRLATDLAKEMSDSGIRLLLGFIDKTIDIDSKLRDDPTMARRARDWTGYQAEHVHPIPESHMIRIPTVDGIEEDALGDWVRSAGHSAKGELSPLSIEGGETRLLSLLVRGLRYHQRAQTMNYFYQSHPLRRDFLLYFGLHFGQSDDDFVDGVLEDIRGVHREVKESGGERYAERFALAEIDTPLLGGRLWSDSETKRKTDADWVELVVGRVAEYRAKAAVLRNAISEASLPEGHLRLRRDLREITEALIRDLGLMPTSGRRTRAETELMQVASVAPAITGVPFVTAAIISLRSSLRRTSQRPHAQFLYKELSRAYRMADKQ
jgi:hypothetical protein